MESSTINRILLLVGVTLLFGTSDAEVYMEMSITEPSGPGEAFHTGSNVTVLCSVRGGYIGMTVYWHKMVVKENGEDVKELLATNDELSPRYKQPRFHYTMVNLGDSVAFILHIYGVQRQDSGHYTCSIPAADDAFASGRMEVYSPPVEVAFDDFANGDSIYFTEGQSHSVTCRITDVLPTPDITITIGSQDLTSDFQQSSELEIKCEGSEGDCPLHFTYHHALTNDAFLPSYQADGAQLTCSASLPGSELPPVEASLWVAFSYAPKIMCQTTQEVQLGAMHDIVCEVHAQPRPTIAQWKFIVGDTEYQIYPGAISDDSEYESFYKEVDSQRFMYTLRIFRVTDEKLVMYHVMVENDLDSTEETVQLMQDMTLPVLNVASVVYSSAFTIFALVLLSEVLRS